MKNPSSLIPEPIASEEETEAEDGPAELTGMFSDMVDEGRTEWFVPVDREPRRRKRKTKAEAK